jgi:hypothetical protein
MSDRERVSDDRLRVMALYEENVHGDIADELVNARDRIARAAEALEGDWLRSGASIAVERARAILTGDADV